MSGDMMSAQQIIEVWRSFHSVELTQLQADKLEAAVLLIAEGSYKAGLVKGQAQGLEEAKRLADAKNWPNRVSHGDPET